MTTSITRRELLKTSASLGVLAGTGMLAAPAIAQSRSIKIGSYGGFFEDSFREYIYPVFEKATGITVESITQPDSSGWLLTTQQAVQASIIPADLSLHVPTSIIKGDRMGNVFAPIDPSRITTIDNVGTNFLNQRPGGLLGVGTLSYYTALVMNTAEEKAPTSWSELWDVERFESSLGIPTEAASPILDITARTFFGGPAILQTREGIQTVIDKIGEMLPNVALWYSSSSQMEQQLKNLDVIGGMLYLDVAGLLASDDLPLATIFPKEGNPVDFNSWALTAGSGKVDEAHEFISFCCTPEAQALMARNIGVAPVIDPVMTDLTSEEISAVAGTPSFPMSYEVLLDNETFINEAMMKMRSGS